MSSRTQRILENARMLFLPYYETTKGLDPHTRNVAIKNWNQIFGTDNTNLNRETEVFGFEEATNVDSTSINLTATPVPGTPLQDNNMSREVTCNSIHQSITVKPLGVATPNNHSPQVNKTVHQPAAYNNITPTYLLNNPSQGQLPGTSASSAAIRENTRIRELYSEEGSSDSSYVPTDSRDTSTSSDECYEPKQKSIRAKRLSKKLKSNVQDNNSQDDNGKQVPTKKAVPRSASKLPTSENRELASNDKQEDNNIILSTAKRDDHRRIYDKRHVCCFCNKAYIKMARHLETCHSNETEVAKLIAQPKKSLERRNGFIKIMRTGDFQHNIEVLSAHVGELILVRRPSEESTTYADYGPCPHCLGFMLKKHIWLHIKQCEEHITGEQSIKKHVMTDSNSLLMSILRPSIDQRFRDNILSGMMNDTVSFVCKNDDLIIRFGALQYEKYCDTQKELIRQSMRQLGRLLLKLRQFDTESKIKSLSNFITPQYFDGIIETVKTLCREKSHSTTRPQYDIPSLALKLGHHLRKCVGILRGQAIRQGCSSKDEMLKNFLQLLDLEWSIRISSNALSTLYMRKMNVAELLPLTSDLLKLNRYISEQIESRMRELTSNPDKNKWHSLAKVTLARIVLFNKRRGGEASKMLITNYNSTPDWSSGNSQELMESLTDVEKELAQQFKLIEIMGKRGKKVPVLLTEEMFLAVSKLMEMRNSVGIPPQNEYVFARPSGGSLGHIRGPDCLRCVVDEVPLEAPDLIRSTKLRKYIATVTQVLNLKENEADWLAKHLGHDIRVHRSFYRLHESAVELTKISRLLMAVDEGKVNTFAGMELENINLNELPNVEPEPDEEEEEDEHGTEDNTKSDNEKTRSQDPPALSRKSKNTRRMWQPEEIKAVTTYFHSDIRNKVLPGKERIMKCKEQYPVLHSRSWRDIKYYVKNFITKLNSKKKNHNLIT